MKIIGAVDIGGTKIAVGAVSETGAILNRLQCPTGGGAQAGLKNIKAMLRTICRQGDYQFTGIGVASPGPLDPFTGIIGEVGTLPGWEGCNVVDELECEFGVPIVLENDADAAALAEACWGRATDDGNLIYVTVSTGIGAGLVLNGELYRGVAGAHPEIGHQVIDPSGPPCYCGATGCWESLASGPAMAAWANCQRPGLKDITAEEICALARHGDELAIRCVERESYYLGLGLANLINIFAPATIVLGGGVMKSADLLLDCALAVIRRLATQVPYAKTRITLASMGPEVGLAGAARGWLHRNGSK